MRSIVVLLSLEVATASGAQQFHTAPADAPSRGAIGDSTERGTRLLVSGRVLGSDGKPIPGASIYAYQTDATRSCSRAINTSRTRSARRRACR